MNLIKEDFLQDHWQECVKECDHKECWEYRKCFLNEIKRLETKSDVDSETSKKALSILHDICSLDFDHSANEDPFHILGFPIEEDIRDNYLDVLEEIIPDIQDTELRSRIADLVWVIGKRGKVLSIAAEAYLESARYLVDPKNWTPCLYRLKRAVDLSRRMGKSNNCFIEVMDYIASLINKYQESISFFILNLVEILLEQKWGNIVVFGEITGRIAEKAEAQGNFWMAEKYWKLQSRCYSTINRPEDAKTSRIRWAETLVRDALEGKPFSHMRACDLLRQAIVIYRQIGGEQERVADLHKMLLEHGDKTIDKEMESFVITLPPEAEGKLQQQSQEKIVAVLHTDNVEEAFKILATSGTLVPYDQLQKEVKEGWKSFSFSAFAKGMYVDDGGKKVVDSKSQYSDDPKEREEALEQQMIQRSYLYHQVGSIYSINPLRIAMFEKYSPQEFDWDSFVKDSIFVPQGREDLFSRALQAGYSGDFVLSTHILATQWEYSIRRILQLLGNNTSKLDDALNQDELSLSSLLLREDIEKFFQGKDIPFHLRVCLGEKLGANLRNKVAHGFMNEQAFSQPEVLYLWWITFFLIYTGPRKLPETTTERQE